MKLPRISLNSKYVIGKKSKGVFFQVQSNLKLLVFSLKGDDKAEHEKKIDAKAKSVKSYLES